MHNKMLSGGVRWRALWGRLTHRNRPIFPCVSRHLTGSGQENPQIGAILRFAGAGRPRHMAPTAPFEPLSAATRTPAMPDAFRLGFGPFAAPAKGVLVVFCGENLKFGPATSKAIAPAIDHVTRAARAERFSGKSGAALELSVPPGLKAARLVVLGVGKTSRLTPKDIVMLGGRAL